MDRLSYLHGQMVSVHASFPFIFFYYYNNTICPSIFPFIYLSIYTGKREIVQVLVIPLRVSLPPTLPTEDVTPRDTLSALFPSVARHYM
jgi:hypothetical protein